MRQKTTALTLGLKTMPQLKPWTLARGLGSALRNELVQIEERPLSNGTTLRGLYAKVDFQSGSQVASYHGKTISRRDLFDSQNKEDTSFFDFVSEYSVETPDRAHYLYPDNVDQVGAHLINHSCQPNTRWGKWEKGVMLVEATRPIRAGEEITLFYGWLGIKAAQENKRHPCTCSAPLCARWIELYVEWTQNEQEDGSFIGGPTLIEREIAVRFLADIANGDQRTRKLDYRLLCSLQ